MLGCEPNTPNTKPSWPGLSTFQFTANTNKDVSVAPVEEASGFYWAHSLKWFALEVVRSQALGAVKKKFDWHSLGRLQRRFKNGEWELAGRELHSIISNSPPALGWAQTISTSVCSGERQSGPHIQFPTFSLAAACRWLLGSRSLIWTIGLWVPKENSPGASAIHQYSLQSPDSCSLQSGSTCTDLIFSHRAEEDLEKISYISDSLKHSVYLWYDKYFSH